MRLLYVLFLSMSLAALVGCSAVKTSVTNDYQLKAYSIKQYATKARSVTLFVSAPEAVAGYQTGQMLYVNKPFALESFAKNAWTSPPADMIFPLLVQSMQRTGYFYAVASSPYSAPTDYRLETQLLSLQQNFLKKPSVLEFSAKIILTHVDDNKVLASRIINLNIPCATDSPYGGVVAANQATQQFTAQTVDFVIKQIKHN